ncbi:unnamed protein product [Dracunculus medinensis]|uniref:MFS_1_like domain-containing protein n=1 Tax=Dracunculus medinensis TaxID=318479 RepID=A0A158Q6I9_DRAME|nr:unnamed protein product [Dracunculus medinensis]
MNDCIIVSLLGRPSSLPRLIEGKHRERNSFIDNIHSMMLENDADNTICRENLLYNPYDCYFHYRLQLIRKLCRYNAITFTLTYLITDQSTDTNDYATCNYEKCAIKQFNWDSFEYLTLEQKWVWSMATFIAALGDSVGMWLGLSIFGLIQACVFKQYKLDGP